MTAQTLPASSVPTTEITDLEEFQTTLPTSSTLRHALFKITDDLKSGSDLIVASELETITPSQAAKLLGISRGHLYKVLDSGALAFDIVGERDAIEDELLDHMD
jgi:excisionase family DNA binding protein